MTTDTTETRPGGAVEEAKETGAKLASSAQEQIPTKVQELGEEAGFQVREQIDQRTTQAGEQVQAIGQALQSGVQQLRSEGQDVPARVVAQIARRADELGGYLESAQADRILADLERFARRRPWLTAGASVLAGFLASRLVKASSERRYEDRRENSSGTLYPDQRGLPAGGS
jgi:hypothetical protein